MAGHPVTPPIAIPNPLAGLITELQDSFHVGNPDGKKAWEDRKAALLAKVQNRTITKKELEDFLGK